MRECVYIWISQSADGIADRKNRGRNKNHATINAVLWNSIMQQRNATIIAYPSCEGWLSRKNDSRDRYNTHANSFNVT